MNFSKNLQKIRNENGFSQEQLAEKIRVSRQSISAWESGKTMPEIDKAVDICKVFQISLDELIGEVNPPASQKFNKKDYIERAKSNALLGAIGIFILYSFLPIPLLLTDINIFNWSDEIKAIVGVIFMTTMLSISLPILHIHGKKSKNLLQEARNSKLPPEKIFTSEEIQKIKKITKSTESISIFLTITAGLSIFILSKNETIANFAFLTLSNISIFFASYGLNHESTINNFRHSKKDSKNLKIAKDKILTIWINVATLSLILFIALGAFMRRWDFGRSIFPIAILIGITLTLQTNQEKNSKIALLKIIKTVIFLTVASAAIIYNNLNNSGHGHLIISSVLVFSAGILFSEDEK